MNRVIEINGRSIGEEFPPYIIAELSGNHNGSMERAKEIIKAASDSGAHAVKLQTYTPDTMTFPGVYTINEPTSLWNGRELHDLYKEAHTPFEWHAPLFDYAHSLGLTIFSSPFDETAVDLLESLNVPAYKIASFENNDIPLLKKVASTGKPIIISTGNSPLEEVLDGVQTLKDAGCKDLIILKCTSTYPASPEYTNLRTIPHMKELYGSLVGLSDHTAGIGASIAAVALGAVLIEKHFTLRRSDGGVDSAFSIEPHELSSLVIESERAWKALGKVQYGVQDVEKKSRFFKRSLYAVLDIVPGEAFTKLNTKVLRPALGLPPKEYERFLQGSARVSIKAGTPLQENHLDL